LHLIRLRAIMARAFSMSPYYLANARKLLTLYRN
jgi:hypothetical protein